MDALRLMEQDHIEVKGLLEQLGRTDEDAEETREQIFTELRQQLEAHETMEEEVFYPSLVEHPKAREVVLEGYEEHHAVDLLLEDIADVPYEGEEWTAKFKVIRENIEHHIEEEEGEMFSRARNVFSDEELEELGGEMEERKLAVLHR
ncbi:MAG TPA: hemerythrin domain-containing protein [Actinomycetota bacterium]|nr:hemerythrin domain-containing protein [Actinomycetota bacterium]